MADVSIRDENTAAEECLKNFFTIASFQGRLAFLLMSIHAVIPTLLTDLLHFNPHKILWYNMLYGIGMHLFARPSMRPLNTGQRMVFSILGSWMFNTSAMKVFGHFAAGAEERPYLMTFFSFMTGRMMILNLLAYLYHVDHRAGTIRRNSFYDSMYR